ncbi:sensor histidine kinase [Streptosporangium sp. NPDC000396]|uniref:sensor histidine kinase n=1 Tax=Streptosporangium sp. NPDC000396 TaxID=3366185 RepID=UPI0036C2AAB3
MTLAAVVIFAAVLGIGVFATSMAVRTSVLREITGTAAQGARQVIEIVRKGVPDDVLPTRQVSRLQVVSRDGRVLAASPMMKGKPPISTMRPADGDLRIDGTACTKERCFAVVGLREKDSRPYGDVMIYAAEPLPPTLTGHMLEIGLTGFSLALLALIGWGTWHVVGQALEPVKRMRTEIAEITAYDLSRRMTVPPAGNELTELSKTVNTTLDRLQEAVEAQRHFASDASHELRTPLTGLRTKLELALAHPDVEDPVPAMRSALNDAERLQAIVNDLLLLARLDAGVQATPERIDLAHLVTSEVEQRPPRHEVLMRLKPDVMVQGNRLQLSRLLTNLIANADRHATSEVGLRVDSEGDEAVLEVTDDGLGIPAGDRERIFQRFTRLDSARSRDAGGTGLGLPIARDIASAHRGRLYATDSQTGRGARFILRLPLATVSA